MLEEAVYYLNHGFNKEDNKPVKTQNVMTFFSKPGPTPIDISDLNTSIPFKKTKKIHAFIKETRQTRCNCMAREKSF